jgi:hypothetical protein
MVDEKKVKTELISHVLEDQENAGQEDMSMDNESNNSQGSSNIAILEKIIHLDDLLEQNICYGEESESADPMNMLELEKDEIKYDLNKNMTKFANK